MSNLRNAQPQFYFDADSQKNSRVVDVKKEISDAIATIQQRLNLTVEQVSTIISFVLGSK